MVVSFAHPIHRAMGTNLLSMLICCGTRLSSQLKKKKFITDTFFFENIVYKNNKIHSWDAQPSDPKCLKDLSYSHRMAFLN